MDAHVILSRNGHATGSGGAFVTVMRGCGRLHGAPSQSAFAGELPVVCDGKRDEAGVGDAGPPARARWWFARNLKMATE